MKGPRQSATRVRATRGVGEGRRPAGKWDRWRRTDAARARPAPAHPGPPRPRPTPSRHSSPEPHTLERLGGVCQAAEPKLGSPESVSGT